MKTQNLYPVYNSNPHICTLLARTIYTCWLLLFYCCYIFP